MKLLRELIEKKGHATIAQFMEIAMYNTLNGYYITQNPIGKNADFITAPEISQLFGEIIGIYAVEKWLALGSPKEFNLVELGPGRGTLMTDLIRATKHVKAFASAMKIHLVETNVRLIEIQREALRGNIVFWHKDVSSLPKNNPTIVIANEFFDCLPINRYVKRGNNWNEQVISIMPKQEEFCFSYVPILAHFNESLNIEHPYSKDGDIVEICSPAQKIIRDLASIFNKEKAYMLIIDYGYDYENKKRTAYNGSLQAVKNHKFHPILSDVGRADITAHVDFFEIKKTARANFYECYGTIPQREFLNKYGINLRTENLKKNATKEQAVEIDLGLRRLTDPLEMGDLFKVLELKK